MKKLIYQKRKMLLQVLKYDHDNSIALQLVDFRTGEDWTTITVCVDDPMPYGVAVIKNYSENEGIMDWLRENRIIHAQIAIYRTGYVTCPVVTVNMQTLAELDPKGTASYKRLHNIKDLPFTSFDLGKIVITPEARQVLTETEAGSALVRHIGNDWGECCEDTWKNNDEAVKTGSDLYSVYTTKTGIRFFIKTESDRSATTVYLPWED